MFKVKPNEIRKGDIVWFRNGRQAIQFIIASGPPRDGRLHYPVEEGNPRCSYHSVYLSQVIEVTREYQAGDWKDPELKLDASL